jgi:hypothetical protein
MQQRRSRAVVANKQPSFSFSTQVPADLLKFGTAVKKKESKLYGAHFKDIDISAKATKMTFGSDSD